MVEYFHLYICTTCSYCEDAISLLEKEGHQFIVTVMDKSPAFKDAVAKHLNFPTVPIVVKGTLEGSLEMVGGYTQLKEYLTKEKEEG
mgnify:CR=1 FL=1